MIAPEDQPVEMTVHHRRTYCSGWPPGSSRCRNNPPMRRLESKRFQVRLRYRGGVNLGKEVHRWSGRQ